MRALLFAGVYLLGVIVMTITLNIFVPHYPHYVIFLAAQIYGMGWAIGFLIDNPKKK